MWAPHPAAFVTMSSASAKECAARRASRRATDRRPLWAASAPQQAWSRGTITRHPVAASTRIVARFTSWNQRSCAQPERSATVPRASHARRGLGDPRKVRERTAVRGDERPHPRRHKRTCDRLQERRRPHEERMRQHPVEPDPAYEPRPPRPGRFHLRACPFHHAAEGHVRGTHVLARAAHQTCVHEAGERVVDLGQPLGDGAHRGDPPARRGALLSRQPVGRAMGEAQPARHARVEIASGG